MDFRDSSQGVADLMAASWTSLAEFLPRVLAALLLIAIGWALAAVLRAIVRHVVGRIERLAHRRTGTEETPGQRAAAQVAAGIVFWLVLVVFVAAATEKLGLEVVTEGLAGLATYLPAVLGAVLIVLAALLLSDVVRRGATSLADWSGLRYADVFGELARALIFVVASVLALDQLGVDSTILIVLSATLLAGIVGGASLAFGLGARTTVGNILGAHYLPESYRIGQNVLVEGITGRIVEIRRTSVVLDTAAGQVAVPAKIFSESISTLVREGADT